MLKIGLTGGIGSGKTTVSDIFSGLGIRIIDTDLIAHDLISNSAEVRRELLEIFGNSILDSSTTANTDDKNSDAGGAHVIDRRKLAKIIFNDSDKKRQLEDILHPRIHNEVLRLEIQLETQLETRLETQYQTDKNDGGYIIIVVPLLLETDFQQLVDRVLVVTADEDVRIRRIEQRDQRTVDEIRSIINNQLNEKTRLHAADDIIENNGDIKSLSAQIDVLNQKYSHLSTSG